jgi:TetR/AcrR family transcriptional regulator
MDNRQQLLDCALRLFSQRGYDAVGVQEIVEEAGVTKPTLYHYFNSKRGLMDALLQREYTRLLSVLLEASLYQGDLVLTLQNLTRAYFNFAQQFSLFYRLQHAMVLAPPESEVNQAVRPYYKEQMDIITRVFILAAEDHGNLKGRHNRYAAGFIGGLNAVVGLFFNQKLDLTDEVIYQTVHQFMYGIFS